MRLLWLGLGRGSEGSIWERRGGCIKEGPLELGFAGRVGVSLGRPEGQRNSRSTGREIGGHGLFGESWEGLSWGG